MKKSFFTLVLAIVSSVWMTSKAQINSLCDEWNVWYESFESFGPISFDKVVKYQLTTDTLINGQQYVKLTSDKDSPYLGAMREGNNRDIYYVPAGSTNEFLLYAFNAQVGEVLNDLYLGGFEENGYSGRVEAISDGSPRLFTIRVLYPDGMGVEPGESFSVTWIEGVGSPETPYGLAVVPTVPADIGVYTLLCAYKNGEQVYTSTMGEQYGCEFNGIPSSKPYHLCDEWNILEVSNVTCGYCEVYRTYNSRLTTDTVIGGIRYTQLIEDGAYRGALREGLNRDIYYIPAGSAHEYLLYAFNAQEGDQLTNLWIGGSPADSPDGWAMTVEEIQETTPRTFVLSTGYTHTDEGIENYPLYITWIEGVGMDGPVGDKRCVGCADSRAYGVLCAYKNGEHIYTSAWGEQYGCEYNRHTFNYLCDEWNVLYEPFSWPGGYNTFKYYLSTDTIINGKQYVKLASDKDYPYCGAFREDNNANIYYIPSGSTHEYLIYAFNAQVGDTLVNLWVGGFGEDYQGVVQAISNGSPRIFTIGVKFGDESDDYLYPIQWIEGVGSPETPMGLAVVPIVPADIGVFNLLCAYKNGEQVYSSSKSERYGCEFNGIPSTKPYHLCDEWNVLEISNVTCGYCEEYRTYNFHLTTDTVIGGLLYSQLIKDGAYKGALREGNNRDIYCVPAGCSQEYLLYAFNAQVGDSLKNIWVGGYSSWIPDVRSAIVSEIKQTTPRTIELEVHYYEAPDAYEESIRNLTWIEGIGMPFGPMGAECSVFNGCADSKAKLLLCAYKNGEHVYTSEWGEQYGCEYNGTGTPRSMFTSDTKWHYMSYDMFAGMDYTPTLSSISLVDTLINNIPYQKIGGILFRTKGTKVWCTMDSLGTPVERLVYDFGLQVGDSIRNVYYDEEFGMEQEYIRYAKVTSVEYITLSDGRSARRISYDNYRPDDIEHIGSVEGILSPLNFPVAECGCGDAFKCCTRNDFLLYEVSTGACDDFFEAEHPADTIPLFSYIGDDPGSSTVDPVDPNQVVVTLKGDVLTIREISGEEITLELILMYKRNQMPALNHIPETETFRNEVTITLTEEGTYTLELTNPSWGYTIHGTFNYPQRKDAIDQNIVPQPAAEKIIRNGQLLIRKGEKVYTVQGTAINE